MPRVGGRMLIVDDTGRLLLIHERIEGGREHWITPGGGLEGDEDPRAAARREAIEEIGVELPLPSDAPEALRTRRLWSHAGTTYDQVDHFFLVRVAAGLAVAPRQLTAMEQDTFLGFRWWTVDELRATADTLTPPELATVLSGVLTAAGERG